MIVHFYNYYIIHKCFHAFNFAKSFTYSYYFSQPNVQLRLRLRPQSRLFFIVERKYMFW